MRAAFVHRIGQTHLALEFRQSAAEFVERKPLLVGPAPCRKARATSGFSMRMLVIVGDRGIEEHVEQPFDGLQGWPVGRDEPLAALQHEQ